MSFNINQQSYPILPNIQCYIPQQTTANDNIFLQNYSREIKFESLKFDPQTIGTPATGINQTNFKLVSAAATSVIRVDSKFDPLTNIIRLDQKYDAPVHTNLQPNTNPETITRLDPNVANVIKIDSNPTNIRLEFNTSTVPINIVKSDLNTNLNNNASAAHLTNNVSSVVVNPIVSNTNNDALKSEAATVVSGNTKKKKRENLTPQIKKKQIKKRIVNKENWKKVRSKTLRNLGKEYLSASGKVVPEKRVQPFDHNHKCWFECKDISEERREAIFKQYWGSGSWPLQTSFIRECVRVIEPKRRRKLSEPRKRTKSTVITLDGKRVCKAFFLKTLDISSKRFDRAVWGVNEPTNFLELPVDKRGKHSPGNKISAERLEEVLQHIRGFPKFLNYYEHFRKTSTKPAPPELSIQKLYNLYVLKCKEKATKPVNSFTFRKLFDIELSSKHKEGKDPLKRRKRDEESWKKNKNKALRNLGKEYVSASGKVVPEKQVHPYEHNCRYECGKFTEDRRQMIFNQFWGSGSWQLQTRFIRKCVKAINPKRRRGVGPIRRTKTTVITLDGKRVCKAFFLKTLDIGGKRFAKATMDCNEVEDLIPVDKRGRHTPPNKIPDIVLNEIRSHIESFPRIVTNHKEYLCDLSVKKMYELYAAKCQEEFKKPVKLCTYRRIFSKEYSLSFYNEKKEEETKTIFDSLENSAKTEILVHEKTRDLKDDINEQVNNANIQQNSFDKSKELHDLLFDKYDNKKNNVTDVPHTDTLELPQYHSFTYEGKMERSEADMRGNVYNVINTWDTNVGDYQFIPI